MAVSLWRLHFMLQGIAPLTVTPKVGDPQAPLSLLLLVLCCQRVQLLISVSSTMLSAPQFFLRAWTPL